MFKEIYKSYKNRSIPLELQDVIRLDEPSERVKQKKSRVDNSISRLDLQRLGLVPPEEWKLFHITSQPGLMIVQNPFSWKGQRLWIQRCLTEYAQYPNKTNLDVHGLLLRGENWWTVCQTDPKREQISKKLRWITMGYHHDWDSKVYSESSRSEIPPEIADLSKLCAKVIGDWDFNAEATIINLYQLNSTLSGHVDYSEPNDNAPLLSFSFGGSAIFSISTPGDHENTSAVLLQSGDIAVMSGKSRLALHGIPKILKPIQPYPWNPEKGDNIVPDEDEWDLSVAEYITSTRINMNVRQVLLPGESALK